jgi:glycerol-3-phosphate dehydrogenase
MNTFISDVRRGNSDFADHTLEYLSRNYGTECEAILKLARENAALAQIVNADGEILAQVTYAIRNEMARTLTDIVMRRTGIGTLGNPGNEVLQKVAAIAAGELGWDAGKVREEIEAVNNLLKLPG